jgi:hypothetical protein
MRKQGSGGDQAADGDEDLLHTIPPDFEIGLLSDVSAALAATAANGR